MNNDLISRSYLKNLPFERMIHTDFGETAIPIEEIDNAPSVEPTFKPIATVNFDKEQLQEIVDKAKAEVLASIERPHGEWVDPQNVGANNWCSVCGEFILHYDGICNYCPNCGADMRKGEEE